MHHAKESLHLENKNMLRTFLGLQLKKLRISKALDHKVKTITVFKTKTKKQTIFGWAIKEKTEVQISTLLISG